MTEEYSGQDSVPPFLATNHQAASLAQSQRARIPGYLGLSSHRELSDISQQARAEASVRVPVLVRLPANKMPAITAHQRVKAIESEGVLGNALWSLAVGETFFHRPAVTFANPADREFANLFAPFWSSRLVSPNPADRAVALAMAEKGLSR